MMKPLLPKQRKSTLTFFVALMLVMLSLPANSQSLLDPDGQVKFVNPLPIPAQIDVTKGANLRMQMNETTQWLGLTAPGGAPLMTTVWGYGQMGRTVTYPGPTFIAKKNVPVQITWTNNLPGHFLPVDASLHMAHPGSLQGIYEIRDWYAAGNVPTVAHLHGGHTESASDGIPEAWFTQNFSSTGDYFVKRKYTYHNDQEAATLWYHDHALGITRLNVYAGLAGFYLLEDNTERKLTVDGIIPKGKHDIEIVIQDRMFDTDGQLFWPSYPGDPAYADFITDEGAELDRFDSRDGFEHFPDGGPTALAEFFGDFIVVNGMAWPYLDVEPRPYRFRLLNGSDSRFYILKLEGNMPFLQIATDDGLLPHAVELTELLIAPGERAEIVVDFAEVGMNNSIKLLNLGPDDPYGGGIPVVNFDPADAGTTGQIMQFNVNKRLRETKGLPVASVVKGTRLRPDLPDPNGITADKTRQLVLFEGTDEYGRLMPMLGTLADGSLTWSESITENPMLNDTEEWEVYNATGDAHPIHLHLVSFLIKNRQAFDGSVADKPHDSHSGELINGGLLTVNSLGASRDPEDNEKGWKDTAVMLPGEVTRVIAKFDRNGRYVWHCHILSHEDHEMMRPFHVGPMPAAGLKSESVENVSIDNLAYFRLYPNPISDQGFVEFTLEQPSNVQLNIYDLDGRLVKMDELGVIQKGSYTHALPVGDLEEGLYILELNTGKNLYRERIVIAR